MRRLIRAAGFLFVLLVATAAMSVVHTTATESDELHPRVLGETLERSASAVTVVTSTSTTSNPSSPTVRAATTTQPPATTTTVPPADVAGAASGALIATAEALIHYDWQDQLPGWSVEFVGPRDGYRGSTFPDSHLIQVYLRPDETAPDLAHALAHELGHAVDVSDLDDTARGQFNVARRRPPGSPWWVPAGADDLASGAGDWAECFAWVVTDGQVGFSSLLGPPPNPLTAAFVTLHDHA